MKPVAVIGVMLGAVLALGMGGTTYAQDELTPDLLAYIEMAQTPADHEALARMYHEEALRLQRKVEGHQDMITIYTRKFGDRMDQWKPHCEALIEEYRQQAVAYEGLSAFHRQEAAAIKAQE